MSWYFKDCLNFAIELKDWQNIERFYLWFKVLQFKKIVLQLNLIKLKLVNSRIFVSFIIFSDTNLFIKGFQILWYKHLNKKMSCLYITCNVKIYNYSFINNIKVIERGKIVNFMNFMVHLFGFRVCKFNQKIAFFYQKKLEITKS